MNIVTGGCSFSETRNCIDYHNFGMMDEYDDFQPESGYKSWALHLEDLIPNSTVHNTAMPGAGNGYISRAVIYKVQQLIDKNKTPDYVVIQLTACDREEVLVDVDDAKDTTNTNLLCHHIPFLDNNDHSEGWGELPYDRIKEQNNNMMWVKFNYTKDSILKYYYKYYNNEVFSTVKTLERILTLQWFLKVNFINYKMFCGWNLFNSLPQIPRYPVEIRHLWKMVDWDNFWFHEKLGGIKEWSYANLPFEERFITGNRVQKDGSALDEHPSNIAHKTFAQEVVSKWIK
jgi:hypothetical protein